MRLVEIVLRMIEEIEILKMGLALKILMIIILKVLVMIILNCL